LYGKDILLLDDGGEFRTVEQWRLLGIRIERGERVPK